MRLPSHDLGVLTLAGVVGAVVGSFLTVVVYRLPRQESIVWPGSRCPACGHRLRWYENIPLLAFGVQRGRCRACGTPIPWKYPVIEGLSTVWSVLVAATFPPEEAVFWAMVGWTWIALAWIDAEHGVLPDSLLNVHLLALLGLVLRGDLSPSHVVGGMLVGVGFVGGLRYLWFVIAGREGLGGGDVKLLALLGGLLGPGGVLWVVGGGALLALVAMGVFPSLRRRVVYFGPYLLLCAALYPWLGRQVVDILVGGVYI